MSRPDSPEAFTRWSTEATCGDFSPDTQKWYQTGQNNLFTELQTSEFFAHVETALADYAQRFRRANNSDLFALGDTPKKFSWNKKTYQSFVEKLFRLNCVENDSFPKPPETGWVTLDQAFAVVNDIVRTTLVVAYADGPDFLATQVEDDARRFGYEIVSKDHAKEKGYYARHVYVPLAVPIASLTAAGKFSDYNVSVEIQIVTQLQGALREITHFLYEKERLDGGLAQNWKHDFRSGRFRAAYMAHSLRFVEAMIVDLRETVAAQIGRSSE